jgi:Zn-dependent M28 family amino/carboxypeptidase
VGLRTRLIALAVAAAAFMVAVPLGSTAVGADSTALRAAVGVPGATTHLNAFQGFANASGNTRVDGTAGFENSVGYVKAQAEAAGLNVTVEWFPFDRFEETAPPVLARTAPTPKTYVDQTDFATMDYSGSGDVTAQVVPVLDNDLSHPGGSTAGCEAADFPANTAGNIALIQRGTCFFREKAENAKAAGAVGVIIFNEGNPVPDDDRVGLLFGTLDPPMFSIPVVGTSFAVGKEIQENPGTYHLKVTAHVVTTLTANVIADTKTGRKDRTVVVGAHLDSVAAGPGINDNGSGSAALLEVAKAFQSQNVKPVNRVRFAWWGAEEFGLIGSEHYVANLPKAELKNIMLDLNFDMIASPNPVRFVYDGNGDETGTKGPNGSGTIEQVFNDYFASQSLETDPTDFDGRSDYGAFIDRGIPAGGLFTGAEGIMTEEQAETYDGVAGEPYDHCYHSACDTTANIDNEVYEQMLDAVSHAVLQFAMTTSSVNGTDNASNKAQLAKAEFKGSKAIR